jgi:hypothetical protein
MGPGLWKKMSGGLGKSCIGNIFGVFYAAYSLCSAVNKCLVIDLRMGGGGGGGTFSFSNKSANSNLSYDK